MRNKIKKILAGAGVLACAGVGLVGCTNVNIDQGKMDGLVDGAETFLDTQNGIDYEELVNNLNEYLEKNTQKEVEEQLSQKITDDNAVNELLKEAIHNISQKTAESNMNNYHNFTCEFVSSSPQINVEQFAFAKNQYDEESKTFKQQFVYKLNNEVKFEANREIVKNEDETYTVTTYYKNINVYVTQTVNYIGIIQILAKVPSGEEIIQHPDINNGQEIAIKDLYSDADFYYLIEDGSVAPMCVENGLKSLLDQIKVLTNYNANAEIDSEKTIFRYSYDNEVTHGSMPLIVTYLSNAEISHDYKEFKMSGYGLQSGAIVSFLPTTDVSYKFGNTTIDFDKTGYISVIEDQANKNQA